MGSDARRGFDREGPRAGLESAQPLIARLPTDAVARTQFSHRVQTVPVIGDEPFTLIHRCSLQPAHGRPPEGRPSEHCYLCSRFELLSIYRVCTTTPPNESLKLPSDLQ
jgi:hypothetical protein